jgi:hypothetical protein
MIGRRIFLLFLSTILAIFSALSFSSEINREDLFSKVGIQAIKGGKKAPNYPKLPDFYVFLGPDAVVGV